MIKIILSTKLGELRWTQADLARATGIRPNTISDLYNCMTDRVNLEHIDLICEALDCDITDILMRCPSTIAKTKPRNGYSVHMQVK